MNNGKGTVNNSGPTPRPKASVSSQSDPSVLVP